jgi:hypothetical protein
VFDRRSDRGAELDEFFKSVEGKLHNDVAAEMFAELQRLRGANDAFSILSSN